MTESAAGDREARPASIRDVARLAGVSHQTVSRVMNGHKSVRVATRLRVLAAIEELSYRPNGLARALATGRSGTIGVLALNSTLYGPSSMLYAVEEAARVERFAVSVTSLRTRDRTSIMGAVKRLIGLGVEGLVVIAPLSLYEESLDELALSIPVVGVDGHLSSQVPVVSVDQVAGARLATEHLLELGHDTVWLVSGPHDWFDSRGREQGWRSALEAHGKEVPPPIPGDWTARSGYEAGQLLARMPEVTAVLAANDHMALGLLYALAERGRSVPQSVSVVGFDDVPEAAYFNPPLTTIRQEFADVGRESLRLLIAQIQTGTPSSDGVLIQPTLVVRRSSGTPPTSGTSSALSRPQGAEEGAP